MKTLNSYNAIILGCGRIAGGYDTPGSNVILTHAHAITRIPEIKLAGLYDINADFAKEMADKWQTNAYDSLTEIFEKTKPDIVVIAVPDEFHEVMLEAALQSSPTFVICEKPLGKDLDKLRDLIQIYRSRNIKIAVNFRRNYDESIIQLKKEIQLALMGEFLNGFCLYSKGLRHNGSHAISLLRYLFGEIENYKILDSTIDYSDDDPSLDLQIQFHNGKKCYLLAADERKYSIFEWQFLFSKMRLIFKNDGFQVCRQEVIDDTLFPGYKTLGEEKCEESGLRNSMSMLYENVLKNIETNEPLLCSALDALTTQTVIEAILDDFQKKKVC